MSAYLVDAARWSRTGDRVTHMRICEADTTTGKLIGNAEVVDINAVVNKLTRNAPVFVDVPFPGNGPQLREQAYGNLV